MSYGLCIASYSKNDWIDLVIDAGTHDEPPVNDIRVPSTGDGLPVEASYHIKDADRASGENKYDKVRFFQGGLL